MGCAQWETPAGVAFLCGDDVESCWHCGRPADWLCDFPIDRRRRCDQPLCDRHRVRQGELSGLDYCPAHALMAAGQVTAENGAGAAPQERHDEAEEGEHGHG